MSVAKPRALSIARSDPHTRRPSPRPALNPPASPRAAPQDPRVQPLRRLRPRKAWGPSGHVTPLVFPSIGRQNESIHRRPPLTPIDLERRPTLTPSPRILRPPPRLPRRRTSRASSPTARGARRRQDRPGAAKASKDKSPASVKKSSARASAAANGAKSDSDGPPSNRAKSPSPSASKGAAGGGGASTPSGLKQYKGSTQQWTVQEDNQLRRLVDEHGHRKWSFIASKMSGRRGKQCRDRWLNHLKPDIRRGEWTQEEERILVEGHRMLGTRWAALAKLLPGRPENAIKNHWHATLRCKWAQRGGKISELQAYQHSLQLTNGGGGPGINSGASGSGGRRRPRNRRRRGGRRRRRRRRVQGDQARRGPGDGRLRL